MNVNVKKVYRDAKIPTYGSEDSAGFDLYASNNEIIYPGGTELIHTGISMAIPKGYVGLIFARSGLATKRDLAPANKVGVIDSDYRGEILVPLHNHGFTKQEIHRDDRVAQMMVIPVPHVEFTEVEDLDDTNRGDGGFGSTGL